MKKLKSFMFICVGIVSIVLSINVFNKDVGLSENNKYYGGDAYTGIQNASAQTARNVLNLNEIVKAGFGGILLCFGITIISIGVTSMLSSKKTETYTKNENIINNLMVDTEENTSSENKVSDSIDN